MRTERNDTRRGKGNVNPFDILEGFLLDDLPAASNPLTGATTARLAVIRWDSGGDFYETDLIETVTNRSVTFSALAVDDYREDAEITTIQFINGEWRPQAGGGGGGGGLEIAKFQILSACPGLTGDTSPDSCNCVQAVVTRTHCTSSIQVGDLITVWDIDICWFNIPLDLLVGRSGTAFLMENNVLDGGAPNCTGYGDLRPEACFWNVESLCCSEEAYAT